MDRKVRSPIKQSNFENAGGQLFSSAAILKTVKIGRYQTALTAALILVEALLLAGSAAADPVGMQQLGVGYSAKLASGFLTSSERSNIKETWTLTPQLRRGNDDMHQRYYSPILGRFISVDPVMGDTGSSQSSNRYSYVENNPLKLVDPDGAAPRGVLEHLARHANEVSPQVAAVKQKVGAQVLGLGVSVGLASLTAGTSFAWNLFASSISNVAGGLVTRSTDGDPATKAGDVSAILVDSVAGAAGTGSAIKLSKNPAIKATAENFFGTGGARVTSDIISVGITPVAGATIEKAANAVPLVPPNPAASDPSVNCHLPSCTETQTIVNETIVNEKSDTATSSD